MLSIVASLAAGTAVLYRNLGSFIGLAFVIFGVMMAFHRRPDPCARADLSSKGLIRLRQFLTIAILLVSLLAFLAILYDVNKYYLIVPLAFGLAFLLLESSERRFCERVTLPMLVLVAWLVRTAPTIVYHGSLYVDAWFHSQFALEIARQGFVRQDLVYSTFPSAHLMIASVVLTTGINDKLLWFLVCGLYGSLALVPIYLLARPFLGYEASMLGCLLIAFLPDSIDLSLAAAPTTFAYLMVPLFLWAAVQGRRQLKFAAIAIFFFLTSSNALMPVIALVMLLMWAVAFVFARGDNRGPRVSSLFILVTALLAGAYWMYVSGWALTEAVRIFTRLASLENFSVTLAAGLQQNYGTWVFQNLPVSLLYALVMFGGFHLLFVRRQSDKTGYVVWGALFLLFAGASYVADLPIISYRWVDFAQLLVAAVSGYGLLLLISKARTMPKLLAVSCLVTIAAFASVTSGLSGGWENGYISNPATYRSALTQSEMEAGTFASTHIGVFKSDVYVALAFDSYSSYYEYFYMPGRIIPSPRIIPVSAHEAATGFVSLDEPLLLRDYSVSKIFWAHDAAGGIAVETYLPAANLTTGYLMETSSRVFDDSNVIWIPES